MKTESQLIQKVINGEKQAFAQFIDLFQDRLYTVCFSILKNNGDAQEATQDTFIKAFKAIHSFESNAKLSTWLYKIAYRTSLDYLRKRKGTMSIDEVKQGLIPHEFNKENIEQKELKKNLSQAIELLKEEEAGLIRMFYLEEMSIKELQEITGLNKSNIKVKLFRARKKLSEIIKDHFQEVESYLYSS